MKHDRNTNVYLHLRIYIDYIEQVSNKLLPLYVKSAISYYINKSMVDFPPTFQG